MSALSQERRSRLAGLPLFAGLPDEDLSLVAETGRWQIISAGDLLIRAGDEGTDLMVTTAGRFEVAIGAAPARTVIATVEAGELLGETVLFRRSVSRSADVAALTDGEALRFSNAELEALIRVGNEEYARANKSFGLTTLRDRHARAEPRPRMLLRPRRRAASSRG